MFRKKIRPQLAYTTSYALLRLLTLSRITGGSWLCHPLYGFCGLGKDFLVINGRSYQQLASFLLQFHR